MNHSNTSNTINALDQILSLIDKRVLEDAIDQCKSDKHYRGLDTFQHIKVMIFAQLTEAKSLRSLEVKYNYSKTTEHKIRRSTLSDANNNRGYKVFELIADSLIKRFYDNQGNANAIVELIDSTTITVNGRGSEWTLKDKTLTGQGLKIHVQYDLENSIIKNFSITSPNINDVVEVKNLVQIESDKTYIFDKGYYDFNWWNDIQEAGSIFITRLKKNTKYKVIHDRYLDSDNEVFIMSDQIIQLTNQRPRQGKSNLLAGKDLRLITLVNSVDNKVYYILSNDLIRSANDIGALYKSRWYIELLFKWLKQNLKIKKFLGESENAIKTQLLIAIITYILLHIFIPMCKEEFNRTIYYLAYIKIHIFCHLELKSSG